jgi:hypothetical protein
MSKFLLNLLLQISKALVNSKNPIFNSEILFLAFGPADPAARSASVPASPLAAPSRQAEIVPTGPSSMRVGRVFVKNTFSLSDHAFPSRRLSLVSLSTGPHLSDSPPSPVPADPGQKSPAPPLPRASDAPELLQPSLITLPP